MNRRKKLKLAIASACAASCGIEQIINLDPASFGLLDHQPRLRSRESQNHEEQQQDEDLTSALLLHAAALSSSIPSPLNPDLPGWWVKPRSPAWFDKFLLEIHDRESWFNAFRMSKPTFIWICNQLQPLLNRKVTRFRDPIPVPSRLAAALYRLTSGSDLQFISERFGIGVSSSQSCITDTVKAINQHFQRYVNFPKGGEKMKKVVSGFFEKCELVNCVGAMGSSSVQVMSSSGLDISGCSMSVHAVCDTGYRFLDVVCGNTSDPTSPGMVRTGEIVSAAAAEAGDLHYLVGDDGFPLLPWLLVRYRDDGAEMAIMGESFNRRHAAGVVHVRAAFGILKDTFKILSGCVKHSVGFVPNVVSACCILHNLLLERDEIPMDSFLQVVVDEEESEGDQERCYEDPQGLELRDRLAEMFVQRDMFKA